MDAAVEWGAEVAGLRGRIWTDKQRFNTEEPILVHYAVQNASNAPNTVWHSGFWPNHRIDVLDPNGNPAKFKSGSDPRWTAFSPGGTREKNASFTLQSGAVDSAYETYNLRDIFDLSAPGTYAVNYLYQETKDAGPVKSNTLQIIVEK